jgi:hypothetical protein
LERQHPAGKFENLSTADAGKMPALQSATRKARIPN